MSFTGYGSFQGAPKADALPDGLYALPFFFHNDATVATGITPDDLPGVNDINPNNPTFGKQSKVYMVGGGENPLYTRSQYSYDGTLEVMSGYYQDVMEVLLNKDYSSYYVQQGRMPLYPQGHLVIAYQDSGGTLLETQVLQDIYLQEHNRQVNLNDTFNQIPFYSDHDWFILDSTQRIVFDKFNGDGSTTSFSLSQTPVDLVSSSDLANDDWPFTNLVFVKVKGSSDNTGERYTSGVSESAGTLTFTTAPAAGSEISVLYAYTPS